jgi:two-component system chemotaxis response regulator CheB
MLEMPAKPIKKTRFDMLAIGSSTGGPPALQTVLASLPNELPFAVAISQHMPAGFTRAFAERLNRLLPFEVKEAIDGDVVSPNQVLIAPGGMNLIFQRNADSVIARVKHPSESDKYVPSVNQMFLSLAPLYGPRLLAAVLTGMGNDGSKGVQEIRTAGGVILAESEQSAVVFGMPREAIATGMVNSITPIELMAREILLQCGILQF